MEIPFLVLKDYWRKFRNGNWKNFVMLLFLIALAVCAVTFYSVILDTAGKTIIENHKSFIKWVIPACFVIGYFHAMVNKDKAYSALLLKFFSNPLIISTLVCLSYGVVLDSSLALLYIVLYDKNTLVNYPYLDTVTVTCTLILALLWSVNGILSMAGNIIWPSKDKVGTTESAANASMSSVDNN